jgi:hypothetical protein
MADGCCGDASHSADVLRAIDFAHLTCLNEAEAGSAARVLRPHEARANRDAGALASAGADAELLLSIPFTSTVRLRALCVAADAAPAAPARVRLFINAPQLDFAGAAAREPAQEVVLADADARGATWHALRAARFNNVTSVQLYFSGNLGAPDDAAAAAVRLFFVGLRAEVTGFKRGVVHAEYEARAAPSDHAYAALGAGAASAPPT